jgi:hypothetical protein
MKENQNDQQDPKKSRSQSENLDSPKNHTSHNIEDSYSADIEPSESEKGNTSHKDSNAKLKSKALEEIKNYSPHSENSSERDHVFDQNKGSNEIRKSEND